MKRLLLMGVLLVLVARTPAQAQGIPVFDAANLAQNVIQALQTILIVGNQVLELTGLDALILGEDFAGDMDELASIVQQAQGLAYDVSSLQAQVSALFSLESAPSSTRELRERLAAIRQVVFQSYLYAMRTQTLLQTTLRTVQRVTRLVATISDFVGNMQANQTMSQLNSTVTETLARLQVQTAAYERAQSVERLTEPLTVESIHRINDALMMDHP
jgi:conjugal transfer/entry exclusion protein